MNQLVTRRWAFSPIFAIDMLSICHESCQVRMLRGGGTGHRGRELLRFSFSGTAFDTGMDCQR